MSRKNKFVFTSFSSCEKLEEGMTCVSLTKIGDKG